jgi:glycerophosphoryl diester phosphodiesterase
VFIQCFEVGTLARLKGQTELRLVQSVKVEGSPADLRAVPYAALLTPPGLASIARYAAAVGADARLVLNPDGSPTTLVADAKAAGLAVHAWTARRENAFLPEALRVGDDPAAPGDLAGLVRLLKSAGVEAIFTDNPAETIAAR